jgi:tRNA nucleotidyltransferase (CCA-adding enzyme)
MQISDLFLEKVLNKVILYGGTPILVGGCVRDDFLGLEVKDYDVEVYGLDSLEELEKILEEFGNVNLVGKSFGILKLSTPDMEYDFSFPRLEYKTTQGHKGFDVVVCGDLEYTIASKRRDFTINSIGYDYKNKNYLDPFYGRNDLKNKVLKHIDDDTFIEDPLRVYRAVQFSARFDFTLDTNTLNLCKKIVNTDEFKLISKERIYEEYKKLFLKSLRPSQGLKLLNDLKIENIDTKTMQYIDEIAEEVKSEKEKLLLIFSILNTLFLKICDDKRLLKNIVKLNNFTVPRIFEKKLVGIHSFTKRLTLKLELLNNMPKPLYKGKDLIKMGYKPSEKFKTILDTLYKMQLNGEIC